MLEAIVTRSGIPSGRRKILFTLGLFLVFRDPGGTSPCPAPTRPPSTSSSTPMPSSSARSVFGRRTLELLDHRHGVNPYINASIIMQLMTVVSTR